MGNLGNSVLAVAAFLIPFRAAAATAYVQLVVATYDEDLSWIEPTLRTVPRSEAIVYCKGPVQPEARCTARLANWGTENYAYVHHVYKNYDNLAPITAFAMGSILKSAWQYLLCRKLFGVLGALSSVAKQDALRHFISPRGMHNHLVPFEPDFNISVYRPKRGLPPQINCPASAATNGAFYSKFAPNRSVGDALRHGSSLNGIAAAPRHVLRGVPRNVWGRLLDELSKKSCCAKALRSRPITTRSACGAHCSWAQHPPTRVRRSHSLHVRRLSSRSSPSGSGTSTATRAKLRRPHDGPV